ncbi:hypothetical protein FLL45_15590 [Aliikangiella marina]|uniref:DUF3450 domain-containing protein n=1 Tax=Aliikangiella marina TaxID=1712262 RepID=A0A545T6N7_9GAMM|nr:hypothetical protein [Aliikangiella marina]TQV72887.1 hypothetical protein FLL45_15590 [Aliikangiella marina]
MKTHAVIKKSLKTTFVASLGAIAMLGTASVVQASDDYNRAQKELRIMSKIFETSLEDISTQNVRFPGSKKVQATYLAKQGMVFTFNFGRNAFGQSDWGAFGEGIGQMVGVIASEVGNALAEVPMPPEAPSVVEPVPDLSVDYEEYFEAYEKRMQALEEMRERHREQRSEVRELQREIRNLERKSVREEKRSKELEQVKRELEQKVEVLNDKMDEYKKSMAEYRKKRDQKYIESTQLKSDAIISTLCDYGATMRSLKSDEHITLIFSDYQDKKDLIYVFDSSDIKRCDDAKQLAREAISYQL